MNNYYQQYLSGGFYHIYHRTSKRQLFKDPEDYLFFLNKYDLYMSPTFNTLAYCLIPNHYHFVVQVKTEQQIKKALETKQDSKVILKYWDGSATVANLVSDQFRRLHSSYALRYKKKYDTIGQVFAHRHKHVGLDKEYKLLKTICYVHHNPIHHGLVNDFDKWCYSSYTAYQSSAPSTVDKTWLNTKVGAAAEINRVHENYRINYKKGLT